MNQSVVAKEKLVTYYIRSWKRRDRFAGSSLSICDVGNWPGYAYAQKEDDDKKKEEETLFHCENEIWDTYADKFNVFALLVSVCLLYTFSLSVSLSLTHSLTQPLQMRLCSYWMCVLVTRRRYCNDGNHLVSFWPILIFFTLTFRMVKTFLPFNWNNSKEVKRRKKM